MTKYLAIAFLITGFLVGDAYGEMQLWDDRFCEEFDAEYPDLSTV